jgi:hypothetical protein
VDARTGALETHQFNYGEPEYDHLYSEVNGEHVLGPTWTDNPIAVEPEDARRIAMAGDPVIGRILDEPSGRISCGASRTTMTCGG